MRIGDDTQDHAGRFIAAVKDGSPELARQLFDSLDGEEKYAVAVLAVLATTTAHPPTLYNTNGVDRQADALISKIVDLSARACSVPPVDVYRRTRTAKTSNARQIAVAASFWQGCTMTDIAAVLGRRHSTISYSLSRVLADRRLSSIARGVSSEASKMMEVKR